jgi:hypothetical protein
MRPEAGRPAFTVLFSFFFGVGAHAQQGRAHSRRLHPSGAACPALMSRATHAVESKAVRGPHRSRRQPTPLPGLRCGARLFWRGVEEVYTQQEQESTSASPPMEGGGGSPPPIRSRSTQIRIRRRSRRSRRSRSRSLGRTSYMSSKMGPTGGCGVVAGVERVVTGEGKSGERGVRLMQAKFLCAVAVQPQG